MKSDVEGMIGTYYVVQIGDEWHVLFEPSHLKNHFLSVARFQDRNRAESYAELENMGVDDGMGPYTEDVYAIPDLTNPPIKAMSVILPSKTVPDAQRELSEFELEVIADLPSLMKEYPLGISIKEIQEWYGV